jgi:hypothetical protein
MAQTASKITNPTEGEANSIFQLAYGGPSVANGSMNVRDLAPALAALAELVERSNELLNGNTSNVELRVLADFESGSFDVNFLLHSSVAEGVAALLPAFVALTPQQLLDVIVGTYGKTTEIISGLAKLYKALHGEKPKEIRDGQQKDTRVIVIGNNNTVITDVNSARLYSDDRIRAALTKAADPLVRDGVDTLTLKRNNQVIETLEREDVGADSSSALNNVSHESDPQGTRDIWVRVVKPNFDGGRWSFHDGSAKFGAELEDKEFQEKVSRREQGFYSGDTFLIRLRSIQHLDKNGGISTINIVEKVIDQREGPRQQALLPE